MCFADEALRLPGRVEEDQLRLGLEGRTSLVPLLSSFPSIMYISNTAQPECKKTHLFLLFLC